jgi:AcrR family transcriptional regulator
MGIAERREREKEALRERIVEAARDIVSEEGLDALSMRAIAERIEYSPATIYLYFRDKDALLRDVVQAGFERMRGYMVEELDEAGSESSPAAQFLGLGRAYVRFAIENTAYFRVMFELPTVAHMDCLPAECAAGATHGLLPRDFGATMVQRAIDDGHFRIPDARRGTLVGWGLVHGLTSLYLSGHLAGEVSSHGEFLDLVEEAMAMLQTGWSPGETRVARAS